jgi:hypothetical protein
MLMIIKELVYNFFSEIKIPYVPAKKLEAIDKAEKKRPSTSPLVLFIL